MRIAMFTNTYLPHVGGVAESVRRLAEDCRSQGHAVCVIAPEYPDMQTNETDVVRVPALQNFNGSDFSMSLPAPFLGFCLGVGGKLLSGAAGIAAPLLTRC